MDERTVYHMRELIDMLNKYTKAYDEGSPLISDQEWDKLYFELKDLEKFLGVIFPDSPTQSISYTVVNDLRKVTHNHQMLSLDKVKTIKEVEDFIQGQDYIMMLKMDGLTCSLCYENGELVSAETRGDGIKGEDILHNALVIPSIPKKIPWTGRFVIDGEIICKTDDFEEFSDTYKNPRNFASGSIRLLDSNECAKRKLTFVAWDIIEGTFNENEQYLSVELVDLKNVAGFTTVPFLYPEEGYTMEENFSDLKQIAQQHCYPIDGIVIKFDDQRYGHSLGQTSHHFKNAIAFKFMDEVFESTLNDIEWSMGRTGVLTPVAIFNPIEIDGSIVSRASLHNITVMEELNEGFALKGDVVGVFKANQIIPQIKTWEHIDAINNSNIIKYPAVCPVCGGRVEPHTANNSTVLICVNPDCSGKLINRLDHFAGKKGLDIKGLSIATLDKLINLGWVDSISDLFNLAEHRSEWIRLPGFGAKSVDNILSAIEASKTTTLHQFIAGLGIPLIGSTASKSLEKQFTSWSEFIHAVESGYKFYEIANFGVEMHSAIKSFDYTEAKKLAEEVITFAITDGAATKENATNLNGVTFVITGKLLNYKNRDELKTVIENLGGKVTGTVTKNTSYLINNDNTSTSAKNKSAKALGVPIITEAEFMETYITN